jgi:hypothetical protein
MALTTTQLLLREAIQRTADVVAFTDKHPVAAINHLINRALGALSTLCRTTNPEFQPIASTTITMDGNNSMYSLPATFRTLLSVEYTGDTGTKDWMMPFELHGRAVLSSATAEQTSVRARAYRLMGSNIEFLPLPPEDHTALVWYATTVTQLSGDAETMDTMERLDSYVIWWAAREIAMEREAWERHDRLSDKLASLEADIRILARSKDLGASGLVTDRRFADRYGRSRRW